MDMMAIIAKILGVTLFIWTARSVYLNVISRANPEVKDADQQSFGERALNAILLWAWLAFCTAFSIGLVVNN